MTSTIGAIINKSLFFRITTHLSREKLRRPIIAAKAVTLEIPTIRDTTNHNKPAKRRIPAPLVGALIFL
jgi:hypothetical protein